MKIVLKEVTISELVKGYADNGENGVRGYDGQLDIRPPYQREFIYKEKQRNAVIDSVWKDFPLNVMYWAVRDDKSYEIIDGQQRTISICQYVVGDFSMVVGSFASPRAFHNLQPDEQKKILDYKLTIYVCDGTESEKLEWFKIINIAGEKLTDQELRNAVYTGQWVSDAKRYFSKTGCAAYKLANKYMTGSSIRQDYLESAIKWMSEGYIETYMAIHQHDANANALWLYFQQVISWVKVLFPDKYYRKEMESVQWGFLYNKYHEKSYDSEVLEKEVLRLMMDDDVTKKSGIYEYVLTGNERALSIRAFTDNMKREAYERQTGICSHCGKHFDIEGMEADHITPWSKGGKTFAANCQMLCKACNRTKSGK